MMARPMRLERSGGGFTVDAVDLGPLLDLAPADVPALMRQGRITSLSEEGVGEDAGRFRLTFRHDVTTVRLTLDADGQVLTVARTVVPPPPQPSA